MKQSSKALAASIADKVVWQFIQAYLSVLLVADQLDWSQNKVAVAAGVSALVTMALAAVNGSVLPNGTTFYADLGLRVLRGAASVFLATLLLEPDVLSTDAWMAAGAAAGAGVLVALKSAAAKRVGSPTSAALVPAAVDDTQLVGAAPVWTSGPSS